MEPLFDILLIRKKLYEMKVKYQAFLLNWIAENEQNPHIHKYKMLSRLLEGEFKHSANIPRFVFDGERILQKLYRENTPQHIEATIDLCSDGEADIDLEAPDDKLPKNSFKNEPLNQKHVDKPEEGSEDLPLINPSEGQQPDLPKSSLDPNEQNNVCSSQLPSNIENEATVTLTSDAEMQDEPRASGLNNETKIQYFDHKDEVELEFEPESIMSTINAVEKTQESNILPPAQEDNVDPHSLSSLHIAEVEPVPARKNSSNKARRPSCAAKSAFGSLQKCTIKKNVLKPAWIYANSKKSQEQRKIISVPYKRTPQTIQPPTKDLNAAIRQTKQKMKERKEKLFDEEHEKTRDLTETSSDDQEPISHKETQETNEYEIQSHTEMETLITDIRSPSTSKDKNYKDVLADQAEFIVPVKRGRGRPRKVVAIPGITSPIQQSFPAIVPNIKKNGRGRPRKIPNIEIKTENLPASQAEQNATPNLFEDPEEALKQLMEMQSKVKQEFDDEPSIVNFNYEEDDFLDENIENIDEQLLFQDLELQILKDLEDNELNMQLAFDD